MMLQGADPELTWTLRLLWIWLKLIYGLAAAVSSILWIANAMLFLEPNPPVFYVFNYLIAFYPFGDKNLWHHILNVIDLVFLLFMILHLFLCTLHGALYFRDRIIIFRVRLFGHDFDVEVHKRGRAQVCKYMPFYL